MKAKLKKEHNQLGSVTTQFKLTAPDGKKRLSNVMDYNQVIELAKNFPNNKSAPFIQWFTYSDETIDGKSKTKAYALFESSLLDSIEVGTVNGLKQIHAYLFGGTIQKSGEKIIAAYLQEHPNREIKGIYMSNISGIIKLL